MNENTKRIISIVSEMAQIDSFLEEGTVAGHEARELEDELLELVEECEELMDAIGDTFATKEAAEAALADAIVNSDAVTPWDDCNVVALMNFIEALDGNS